MNFNKYRLFGKYRFLSGFIAVVVLFGFPLSHPALFHSKPVSGGLYGQPMEDEEEEEVQAYPNPLERTALPNPFTNEKNALRYVQLLLTRMGFTVTGVKKIAGNQFQVTVSGWSKSKAQGEYKKGVISWDPTQRTGGKIAGGKAMLSVRIGSNKNLFIGRAGLKRAGLQMKKQIMRSKTIQKQMMR